LFLVLQFGFLGCFGLVGCAKITDCQLDFACGLVIFQIGGCSFVGEE